MIQIPPVAHSLEESSAIVQFFTLSQAAKRNAAQKKEISEGFESRQPAKESQAPSSNSSLGQKIDLLF